MENLICCIFTFCKILIITYNIKKILISIKKVIIKENLHSPILNCTTLFLICWMNEDPIINIFFGLQSFDVASITCLLVSRV